MTTGRINQIAFGKTRMIVRSIRFGKESTPSHKRTEQTFEAKSAEWSPTSDRIRPLHGCLFEMQIPRDGLRCVCIHEMSLCTRGRQGSASLSSPRSHSVVARLQFSKGIRNSSQSVPRGLIQKRFTTIDPQGRRHERLSDAWDFRVGTIRCTVS